MISLQYVDPAGVVWCGFDVPVSDDVTLHVVFQSSEWLIQSSAVIDDHLH